MSPAARFAGLHRLVRLLGTAAIVTFAALSLLAPVAVDAAAAEAAAYQPVLARAEAIVTVAFVLRIKIEGSGDRDIESEADCLMIAADGLVLCSNTELGGYVSMLGRMIGGGRVSASGTPSDIKVRSGDQTEGAPARLVTRDSERDLAWLQIEAPAGDAPRPALPFLDLEAPTDGLSLGDRFLVLRRMHRFFDRATVVVEGTVGAVIDKPRQLVVPAVPLELGFGLPVFTETGALAGVTVMQTPTADEAQSLMSNPMSFLSSSAKVGDMVGGLVLPTAELARATALAREIIAADAEE